MNMNQLNAVSHMTQNEDFDIISRTAVVNNDDNNIIEEEINMEHVFEEDGIEDESETQREKDKAVDCNIEIPSIYTNLDEKSLHADNNWLKSYSKSCKWTLRGSKRERSGLFEISKYTGPHTCLHYKISQDHPNLDSSVIAQEIQHLIKAEPSTSITVLRAEIIDKLGYTPTYKKVWVGKQKAIEHVFGDWDESYNILPKFLMALQTFNPGTIVEWCVLEETGQDQVEFRRVFWAFDPSIKGFKHCRPVISIDGTHLYGKYKGKMMIAMGVDGNNQILPLAFAIVENESFASWNWFLSHIKRHVVKDVDGICLISDRHPGILKAVNEQGSPWLEPRGYHSSQLKTLAYRAGSQNQIRKFNSIMEEIGTINPQARQWLEGHPRDKWTLAYDGGKRNGLLTTNLSEIFNSVLKGARFLPITACVQLTFYRLVHYFEVRRPLGSSAQANGDIYTPHVTTRQTALMSKASAHSLRSFDRQKGVFEVITQRGKNIQVVNLELRSCTCGKWDIYKYPCSHVLSACAKLLLNPWQYVHECYSIINYCATWSSEFSPIPHEAYWPQAPNIALLSNSELKRDKRGRPRSTRLRNGMDIKEGKKSTNCGICGERGHNRATCKSKLKKVNA
uniref:uncharacterized protein LOC122597073 n=1 Tax=Erigeron canadensis TaxID=72917 RepID=UPI001CB99399|nr:uncharacterized protein LOC122597073 [Erigeron canadensis]